MDGSNREINEYDLLIKNGQIIDGTGKPSFLSDIGIKDGIIKKLAKLMNLQKKLLTQKIILFRLALLIFIRITMDRLFGIAS